MPTFRQLLSNSSPILGTIITLPQPEVVEMACQAGFDWLWLDMEHGLLDVVDVQRALMAAGQTPCLARVPVNEEAWIKRVLDSGVDGVIIPQVNSAAQAAHAIELIRYPPAGRRSVGAGRAQGYGQRLEAYLERANRDLVVVVQIEHSDALDDLDAILATPGLDGIMIGPYDLSASLGKAGQLQDAQVRAAITRVRQACQERGLPVGIFSGNQAAARAALAEGFQMVAAGMDIMVLSAALENLRRTIEEAA